MRLRRLLARLLAFLSALSAAVFLLFQLLDTGPFFPQIGMPISLDQSNSSLAGDEGWPPEITASSNATHTADGRDFCDGENMAYNVSSSAGDGQNASSYYFLKGKPFECSLLGHLMRYKLTDKYHRIADGKKTQVKDPRFFADTVFVFAADYAFYASLRAVIVGVREKFASKAKMVVYDLGGLSSHQNSQIELSSICNLELRTFNFSLLPPTLHKLKLFAWKVLILAEMFAQFESFVYCDTSIHFLTNEYQPFFQGINSGMLSDVQFPLGTHHGLKFATHPDMFHFLPLDPTLTKGVSIWDDVEMMEANMIIVRRSEFSRRLLKWSLLCALTLSCIQPEGAQLSCQHYDADQLVADGQCHRQDQSTLNILLHNLELELVNSGSKITPHLRYNHPRNWATRHVLKRGQQTWLNIAERYKCQP